MLAGCIINRNLVCALDKYAKVHYKKNEVEGGILHV
jgi:hypothetical protein